MESMEDLLNAIKLLNDAKHNLHPHYIKDVTTTLMKDLTKITGKFLHNLYRKESTEESVKKMIDACPASLSFKCDGGYLPIQTAVHRHDAKSIQFIPLLATEGVRYNVGGSDSRGGLLLSVNRRINVFSLPMLRVDDSIVIADTVYHNMFKKLKEEKLLFKEDIGKYGLLYNSYRNQSPAKLTFEFLADIDPQALKAHIHVIINGGKMDIAQMFLTTALKYFPTDIGVLFQKNNIHRNHRTAFRAAINKFGEKATFDMIEKFIPLDGAGTLPILHHVAEHEPDYLNEFVKRYPSSFFVRDQYGRTIQQTELASGLKSYNKDAAFYVRMSDDQVCEKDPGNDLYPFMVAACDSNSDLGGVYYLLRRNPSLVSHGADDSVGNKKRRTPPVMMEDSIAMRRRTRRKVSLATRSTH
jgi:hypothetical protein